MRSALIFSVALISFHVMAQTKGPVDSLQDTSSLAIPMVLIKGGSFQMGNKDGPFMERPTHIVTLGDYYLGKYEVTFAQYDTFCIATGREKPYDEGWGREHMPVMNIDWYSAIAYCNWLSKQQGLQAAYHIEPHQKDPNNRSSYDTLQWRVSVNWDANGYRLPTEAEWEYAARGRDLAQQWSGTSVEEELHLYANSKGKNDGFSNASPVGSFFANALGLYDMSGNLGEWCWDWFGPYPKSNKPNPLGPDQGAARVLRGACFLDYPGHLRNTRRYGLGPNNFNAYIGFRVCRTKPSRKF